MLAKDKNNSKSRSIIFTTNSTRPRTCTTIRSKNVKTYMLNVKQLKLRSENSLMKMIISFKSSMLSKRKRYVSPLNIYKNLEIDELRAKMDSGAAYQFENLKKAYNT